MKKFYIVIYFLLAVNIMLYGGSEYAGSPVLDSIGGVGASYNRGIDAIYFNPAGLSGINKMSAIINYQKKYAGLLNNDLYSYNIAYGLDLFSVIKAALSFRKFDSSYYNTTEFGLAVGNKFFSFGKYGFLASGISFKYNFRKFIFDKTYTEVGSSLSKSFLNINLGIIYSWNKLNIGIFVPSVAHIDMSGQSETDDASIITGLSYDLAGIGIIELDYSIEKYNNKINFGVEKWFGNNDFSLKGGINSLVIKSNITLNDVNFTLGFSFKINMFFIDYAFLSNSKLGESYNVGIKWNI